jgi:hypothetical protein
MTKTSTTLNRISNQLDEIRFTGMDQNPKGIRDELFCTIRQVKVMEKAVDEKPKLGAAASHYPSQFSHGSWDCEDSPTGNCMYTTDFDCCIFCEEPDERK